jgi:4-amino-4-deoxy-L-arabinose transferase-like glycosyltransferase
MSSHWSHILASWALVGLAFAALGAGAFIRHRAAAAMLKRLDPRGERDA